MRDPARVRPRSSREPRPLALALVALLGAACGGTSGAPDAGDAARPLAPMPAVVGLPELMDRNPDPRVVEVDLTASETDVQFVEGRNTHAMAYNGRVPGPLLHARVGDRVIVHFKNELTEPTTVHWHGLRISDEMDGSPRIQTPVQPGETFVYDFVVPEPGTFWYHAHVHETQQMEKGLYGAIVVHEAEPPQFRTERVIVLDDIRLNAQRQIAPFNTSGPDIGRGRVGNYLLVNGRTGPETVDVPPGAVERWRIINGGNALTHTLGIEGAYFRVIATDGGFLPTPTDPAEIELSPGQRVDLEVRFAMPNSTQARLVTYLQTLDANNRPVTQDETMLGVNLAGAPVMDPIPSYPSVTLPSTDAPGARQLDLLLSGAATDAGVQFTINGTAGHMHRTPPVQVMQNEPVRITIRSEVSPEHPFHLHGQFFQVVERGGQPVNEPGLFDVALVRGNEPLTILTRFENPGMWMYHCHIAEHSENGMMGEFEVLRAR